MLLFLKINSSSTPSQGLFSSLAIPVILRLEGKEALYWHDSMVLYTVSMSTFMGIITGSLLRNRYRLTSLLLGTIFMMLMSPIIAQVVVFAFATSQRLMVLVWWMGLLIVLLPMIHLISKSKVVPNIIGNFCVSLEISTFLIRSHYFPSGLK